ncbi:MAG: CHAT domain-containing protein, partial [Pseudonocardiaceae bacterium]
MSTTAGVVAASSDHCWWVWGGAVIERWDVFISYAHEDEACVRVLTENLHRAGRDVFFDRWDVAGEDRLSQRLQQGLAASNAVVLVVSQAAVNREWWQEEFAAAMAGVAAGVQRLIPVLLDDVPLPPFVAGRVWVDFRYLDRPAQYEACCGELLRAVQGIAPGNRPRHDEGITAPPRVYRAEGPRAAQLCIDRQRVAFSTADQEWSHPPLGVDGGLRTLVWEVERARRHPGDSVVLKSPGAATAGDVLHSRLTELGRALGSRFLAGDAGVALAQEVTRSQAVAPLRLVVQVDDQEWADLPWETLVLPGQQEPLVLQHGVQMYRVVQAAEPVAVHIPGPLRILAVIASPERGGGDLLDYEAELARILAVVDPTHREQNAHVRVLNGGSRAAIRQALAEERFHVLHLCCHAEPGALVLESDTGQADVVTAREFVDDVLVADHGVPLVVLAGCSTALADRKSPLPGSPAEQQGEQALPGLARDLLHAGVPAVLAMTAPITDRYATELCAQMYQELARRPEPVVLAELSTMRRELEQQRRRRPADDPDMASAEWATPALFLAGPPLPLYRRADGMAPLPVRSEAAPALGGMIRRVGDFGGRRAELRALLRDLRAGQRGVVLHGIGGIGKSSLTAQLVDQLSAQAGLVVPIVGHTQVDLVIEAIRQRLHAHCLRTRLAEMHPHRKLVKDLIDATPPWQ